MPVDNNVNEEGMASLTYPRSRIDGCVQSHCLIDGRLRGYGKDAIPSYVFILSFNTHLMLLSTNLLITC